MKKIRSIVLSLLLGIVLSFAAVAIYAGECCDDEIQVGKLTCWLTGENCGGGVGVCSYNCG